MNDMTTSTQISRPLNVLVPLIKSELERGDKAGEEAARPYHEKAGGHLIEAALADDTQGADEFWDWAEETFERPRKLLRACMEIAFGSNDIKIEKAPYQTLADLMRAKGKGPAKDWRAGKNVHDAIKQPLKDAVSRPKLHAPKMKLIDERALQKKLAKELIDIGYRALAARLHPDKRGGSKEAMRRLNDVRAMLKKCVERR
jgi:hypothetical protein